MRDTISILQMRKLRLADMKLLVHRPRQEVSGTNWCPAHLTSNPELPNAFFLLYTERGTSGLSKLDAGRVANSQTLLEIKALMAGAPAVLVYNRKT